MNDNNIKKEVFRLSSGIQPLLETYRDVCKKEVEFVIGKYIVSKTSFFDGGNHKYTFKGKATSIDFDFAEPNFINQDLFFQLTIYTENETKPIIISAASKIFSNEVLYFEDEDTAKLFCEVNGDE